MVVIFKVFLLCVLPVTYCLHASYQETSIDGVPEPQMTSEQLRTRQRENVLAQRELERQKQEKALQRFAIEGLVRSCWYRKYKESGAVATAVAEGQDFDRQFLQELANVELNGENPFAEELSDASSLELLPEIELRGDDLHEEYDQADSSDADDLEADQPPIPSLFLRTRHNKTPQPFHVAIEKLILHEPLNDNGGADAAEYNS